MKKKIKNKNKPLFENANIGPSLPMSQKQEM
jgi:hypothetical protein